VTIHSEDPFATPEGERTAVRRLRGRLAATVTLWTAPGPVGLTVSSVLVADGEPGRVLGLIDDESELWPAIEAAGAFAVELLGSDDRQLADRFAGLLPAPGGLFRDPIWTDTEFGPVRTGAVTWAGCRLEGADPCGWGLLVRGVLETVQLGVGEGPLMYHRGRYRNLES
jgi:3-hydroxy-9,10-secoandrosta-1,3,5(10)-triene-9,17-dione monooxygenase reductase component